VVNLGSDIFMETMRRNALGPFLCSKYVIPLMLEQGSGSIINMASVSGMAGETGLSAYGMSKAAVIQLTRAVAVQYGKRGVRCNAVAPALVLTRNVIEHMPPQYKHVYSRHILTPHVSPPQDIADVVAFLASDRSRSMTGHVIPVDGGIEAASPIVADMR
jgi:NAD(P)-dependent dehydrogenase (short-subunit alcohol dehydrogenase family)